MRYEINNWEDEHMTNLLQVGILDNIKDLFRFFSIDYKHLSEGQLRDMIIDLGRLCYIYRKLDFAIGDYKCHISNKVDIDTNQFCDEEDIY